MPLGRSGAAIFAALLLCGGPARGQDVALTARSGGLTIEGALIAFDGEYYRLDTAYGVLTVDAAGVDCAGPGCPELGGQVARLRLVGDAAAGRVLPGLMAAMAAARGQGLRREATGFVMTEADGTPRARVLWTPLPQAVAEAALADAEADLILSPLDHGGRAVPLGRAALVPVVHPDNPLDRLSTRQLTDVLTGRVRNWADLGGPDMPLVLHGPAAGTAALAVLAERLGADPVVDVPHAEAEDLTRAVARDPWAIALTTDPGPARAIALTDRCGFVLPADPLAVKAGDYPLVQTLHLIAPARRLPPLARDLLDFLPTGRAQAALRAAGLAGRGADQQPLLADGRRLAAAIRVAAEVGLPELQRLAAAMDGAQRLSFTFRFRDGSRDLDPASRAAVDDLARLLAIGAYDGQDLIFAGFSDGQGEAAGNRALSLRRAEAVRQAVFAAAPDLDGGSYRLLAEGFGEALPLACDETAEGRGLNRRVELWLRPTPPVVAGDPSP